MEHCSKEQIEKTVQFFKAMGDTTRLCILLTLFAQTLSVSEISEKVKMSPSAVSHQLKLLKLNKLVKSIRNGKQQIYSLDDSHVKELMQVALCHIRELD